MIRRVLYLCALMLVCFSSAAGAQCPALNSMGLVAHWTLDETGGGTIADASGNGNAGTWTDGVNNDVTEEAAAGTVDGALNFDGVDDHVSVSDNALWDFAGKQVTVSAWFKASESDPDDKTIAEHFTGGSPGGGWRFYVQDDDDVLNPRKLTFIHRKTSGSDVQIDSPQDVDDGVWHHGVAVIDDVIQDKAWLYVDGQEVDSGTLGTLSDENTTLCIGADCAGSNSRFFPGLIDDVRIYNRALSAAEIAALYAARSTAAAQAGQLAYDTRHARLMYCNGTDWVHAGIGSYNPNAVYFDGTNDYLNRGADLTGNANSKLWTGSLWFRLAADASASNRIYYADGANATIYVNSGNSLWIEARNSANTIILGVRVGPNGLLTGDRDWHHLQFSLDMANQAASKFYLDDVEQALMVSTWTDDVIEFTKADHGIGAQDQGGQFWNGDLADLWIDFGTYIDLSIEANRRKFRSAAGLPKYLGKDGSTPTGEAPEVFMSGGTDDWHTNLGAGGGFTENGALTTASTQPGNTLLPGAADTTTGLIGYWKLDEGSGTTAADSSGDANDGTLTNMDPNTDWVTGQIGGGLDFDGTDDYVNLGTPTELDLPAAMSVFAWVKFDTVSSSPAGRYMMGQGTSGSGDTSQWSLNVGHDSWPSDVAVIWSGGSPYQTSFGFSPGIWYHVGFTRSGTSGNWDISFYVNGSVEGTATAIATDPVSTQYPTAIGALGTFGSLHFDGDIDDVRIYNRALSADDVKALYGCGAPPGMLRYDPDFSVMTYCNGVEWVAMGPVGGTPPTAGLVGHWKLDEASGTVAADSSGNGNDGTLTNMDPATDWVAGKVNNALDFDGVDDSVSLGNNIMGDSGGTHTISAWINTPFNEGQFIVTEYEGGVCGDMQFMILAGGNLRFTDGQGGVEDGVGNVIDGLWHHVAVVSDVSELRFYIDGQLDATTGDVNWNNSCNLDTKIGEIPDDLTFNFKGKIDDLRIYNRALSAQEVAQLYHYGLSGGLGDVSGNCSNPDRPEGTMLYNLDHNYLQYCNGEAWIGIGK